MSYINAAELLPKQLLTQIQEYAGGSIIYIPNKPGLRKCWGEATKTRTIIDNRNREIKQAHISGCSVRELSAKYFLAESTVKKIVYASTLRKLKRR